MRRTGGFSSPWLGRVLLAPDGGETSGAGNGTGGGAGTSAPPSSPPTSLGTGGQSYQSPGVGDWRNGGDTPAQGGPASGIQPGAGGGGRGDQTPGGGASPGAPSSTSGQGAGGQQARPTPTDPNQAAGAAAGQPDPSQAAWTSIRDAARAFGVDLSQFPDDRAALAHLVKQSQRNAAADYYAQLGRRLAPQAPAIQQYLTQQQQAQQGASAQRPAWEAPPFDQRWMGLVERDDATGIYVGKPGVPPEIAAGVNEFVDWKRGFDTNPAEVINKLVDNRARAIAQESFQQQYGAQQEQMAIQQIHQQTSPWLYNHDANGRMLVDPYTNRPSLSPVGAAYMQQLQSVVNAGVTGATRQHDMAMNLLRGMIAQAQIRNQQAQQDQSQNPQTQQGQHSPNVNPLGSQPSLVRNANPAARGNEPSQLGRTLADRLREDFRSNGVAADQFRDEAWLNATP